MRITMFLFVLIGINFCNAQTNFKKEIIGSWEFVSEISAVEKEEKKLSISKSGEATPDRFMKSDVILRFKNEKAVVFEIDEFLFEAAYTINNTDLRIGNRQYTLLKIQHDSLFFEDKGQTLKSKYIYKRIK